MFKTNQLLDKQNILKKVSELDIFSFYVENLKLNRKMLSPLRTEEHPSFGIYIRDGRPFFKDFRIGTGDVFKFLMLKFNLSFKDTLSKINTDLGLKLLDTNTKVLPKTEGTIKLIEIPKNSYNVTKIFVKPKAYTDKINEYLNQYGIREIVYGHAFETYPISHFRINDNVTIKAEEIAFALDYYNDGKAMRRKIYQPEKEGFGKWYSNITSLVVDGIKELPPTGDLLIITKSRKDRYVLMAHGYNAISTNNEVTFIPDKEFEKLKKRFKHIVLFFDNDETGLFNSQKFSIEYNIPYILIPSTYKWKDISDFRKNEGSTSTKILIKNIIENAQNSSLW